MELSNKDNFMKNLAHKSSFPASSQVKNYDRARYVEAMPMKKKFSTETLLTQLDR